jgi:DNA-binding PadR family transcriptional regulator
VKKKKENSLTIADLVLLSLLAEKPMHGYQANAELERREIRDWAAISRPQVYYSLEKLARLGFLRRVDSAGSSGGPEKQRFAATKAGLAALADALERQQWCIQREKPAFLTWMALSWQARKGVFERQLQLRTVFLQRELAREQETLRSVLEEVGHPYREAVWMLKLMIAQFATELRWIAQRQKELHRRARAKHPALAEP